MSKTINLTPTWGEWGNVYRSLAERSSEAVPLKHLAPDLARALASCQALNAIGKTLTDEQQAIVSRVIAEELIKQGF